MAFFRKTPAQRNGYPAGDNTRRKGNNDNNIVSRLKK
jgi:hypothetical protein